MGHHNRAPLPRTALSAAPRWHSRRRRGIATVELSLLLPFLIFLLLAGMDYSRIFYTSVIVTNCARNGALYASDPNSADRSTYETLADAVRADAINIDSSLLQVTKVEGTDASGYGWVEVNVVYPFSTVINYPGIPTQTQISRTIRMRKTPVFESDT